MHSDMFRTFHWFGLFLIRTHGSDTVTRIAKQIYAKKKKLTVVKSYTQIQVQKCAELSLTTKQDIQRNTCSKQMKCLKIAQFRRFMHVQGKNYTLLSTNQLWV